MNGVMLVSDMDTKGTSQIMWLKPRAFLTFINHRVYCPTGCLLGISWLLLDTPSRFNGAHSIGQDSCVFYILCMPLMPSDSFSHNDDPLKVVTV